MVPHNIKIKNYKSYGDEETVIDLSNNSVKLVYGNIGAGKTTFVDGIIWCLYGESLVNVNEVINRKTKKNCKVEFNFSIVNEIYSIIRYRKHETYGDDVVIFKNHKNISPVKKREAQELINSIVGMNHKAMVSSVMFSSEIYISFLRVREAKRLEIFDSVLNMNIFKKWNDQVKKMKAPLEEEYEALKNQVDKVSYGIDTVNETIKDYKDGSKKKLQELKNKRESLNEERKKIEEEVGRYNHIDAEEELVRHKEYYEIKEKNKGVQEEIDYLENKWKKELNDFNNLCKKYSQEKEELERLDEIDFNKEIDKIQKEKDNERTKKEIFSLKEKIVSVDFIDEQINRLNKQLEGVKDKLEKTDTNICYTCGQPINKEATEKIVKNLKTEREEINLKLNELNNEKSELDKNNKRILEKVKKLEENVIEIDINYTEEELKNLDQKKKEIKNKIELLEKDINYSEKTKDDADENIRKLNLKLLTEPEAPTFSKDFLENLKDNISKKNKKIEELCKQINTIQEQAKSTYSKEYVNSLEEKVKSLKEAKKKKEEVKSKKAEDLKYYIYLLKLLSNKDYGIKKYIISKMIDIFNKNINKYIPLFFDREIKVEFDKNLKEEIYENKQKISFNSFSSGEKSLLDISIAFSLYMLVKSFFSSDIRFLVFDEILDRNLDEEGIQAILQVINELAKENSIMVISHRTELQESFDRRIHVYKEDGFSKIETTF